MKFVSFALQNAKYNHLWRPAVNNVKDDYLWCWIMFIIIIFYIDKVGIYKLFVFDVIERNK